MSYHSNYEPELFDSDTPLDADAEYQRWADDYDAATRECMELDAASDYAEVWS